MKILSYNCQGLESPSKKLSLKHLIDNLAPDIILLQETMGYSEVVVGALKNFLPGWEFAVVDARGRVGGSSLWLVGEGV